MCGLAAHDKPRVVGLSQGFQDNLTGLNKSQTLSQNISKFRSSQTLLMLVANFRFLMHETYQIPKDT